jgi:hypothetical protein
MGKSYVQVTYKTLAMTEDTHIIRMTVKKFIAQSASEALRLLADWNTNGNLNPAEKTWAYLPIAVVVLKETPLETVWKPASLNGICYWEEL